jgi:hypothetical protein
MRLLRLRFTTRRAMALVLLVGITLHLTITSWRVYWSRPTHIHTGVMGGDQDLGWLMGNQRQAFWPVFWRRAVGLSSKDRSCTIGGRVLEEICELDHPEIRRTLSPTSYSAIQTQSQIDVFVRLAHERGYTVHYGKEYVSASRKGTWKR